MVFNKYINLGIGSLTAILIVFGIIILVLSFNSSYLNSIYGLFIILGIMLFLTLFLIIIGNFYGKTIDKTLGIENMNLKDIIMRSKNKNIDKEIKNINKEKNLSSYLNFVDVVKNPKYIKKDKKIIYLRASDENNAGYRKEKGIDYFGIPLGKTSSEHMYSLTENININDSISVNNKFYSKLRYAIDDYINILSVKVKELNKDKIMIPIINKNGKMYFDTGILKFRKNICNSSDYFTIKIMEKFSNNFK